MSKVWRYGDHVDTDVIIPARYLNISDFNELAEHAMEDSKENLTVNFAANVKPGDIVVAGKNFGCGSSREHAPMVLKVKGVKCIIADSFARIFYRNAINIGLPVLEIGTDVEKLKPVTSLTWIWPRAKLKLSIKTLPLKLNRCRNLFRKLPTAAG